MKNVHFSLVEVFLNENLAVVGIPTMRLLVIQESVKSIRSIPDQVTFLENITSTDGLLTYLASQLDKKELIETIPILSQHVFGFSEAGASHPES